MAILSFILLVLPLNVNAEERQTNTVTIRALYGANEVTAYAKVTFPGSVDYQQLPSVSGDTPLTISYDYPRGYHVWVTYNGVTLYRWVWDQDGSLGAINFRFDLVDTETDTGETDTGEEEIIGLSTEWQLLYKTGDWISYSQTYWETPYSSNYSCFVYAREIDNFQHLKVVVHLEDYDVGGYWGISEAYQLVVFELMKPNGSSVLISVSHNLRIHFLAYKDVVTSAYVLYNNDLLIPAMGVTRNMYVEIHAWKRADNKLVVAYMYKYDPNENATTVFDEEVIDVDPNFFDNLVIFQRVHKELVWGAGAQFNFQFSL